MCAPERVERSCTERDTDAEGSAEARPSYNWEPLIPHQVKQGRSSEVQLITLGGGGEAACRAAGASYSAPVKRLPRPTRNAGG